MADVPAMKQCPKCLEFVAKEAKKCKFCASDLDRLSTWMKLGMYGFLATLIIYACVDDPRCKHAEYPPELGAAPPPSNESGPAGLGANLGRGLAIGVSAYAHEKAKHLAEKICITLPKNGYVEVRSKSSDTVSCRLMPWNTQVRLDPRETRQIALNEPAYLAGCFAE